MPLSLNAEIRCDDLDAIFDVYPGPRTVGSKAGKIFKLVGLDGSRLFIKDDAIDKPQIKSASLAMGAVHTASRAKKLKPAEEHELKEFVYLYFEIRRAYEEYGMKYRSDMLESMQKLQEVLADGRTQFHKMPPQYVQDVQGALEKRLNGDKTELQAFAAALAGPNGLECLGEIIAADLFNGNTDRFFPYGWDPENTGLHDKQIGGRTFTFRALVNPKNIFRAIDGPTPISGLDFMDPSSRYKNMDARLGDHEQAMAAADLYKWPARIMLDESDLRDFAEDIITDLELLLSPNARHFKRFKRKLGRNRKARIINGLKSGMRKIKTRLVQKYPLDSMPPAIKDRYDIIDSIR